MSRWRDHDVCCMGGCGTVLEDRTGKPLVEVHRKVETAEQGEGGLHIVKSLWCMDCAAKEEREYE